MAVNCASVHQHQGGYRFLTAVNARVAHDAYDSFVDVSLPILEIHQFAERQNLPLNERCMSVFHAKTAYLRDQDWIELDRSILELVGFKNSWTARKSKDGSVKRDSDGNPVLMDTRNDFSNAIRCLKNINGFVEGQSFDDSGAHFLITKSDFRRPPVLNSNAAVVLNGTARIEEAGMVQQSLTDEKFAVQLLGTAKIDGVISERKASRGGSNKQSIWIRLRALEHFIIMANTCNSFMVREFLLDLKRILSEYTMYARVYRDKYQLSIKDSTIDKLSIQITELLSHARNTTKKLDTVIGIVRKTEEDVVVPAESPMLHETVILMVSEDKTFYAVRCVQNARRAATIRQTREQYRDRNLTVLTEMKSKPNAKNILHRFKQCIRGDEDLSVLITFSSFGTTFEVLDKEAMRPTDVIDMFMKLINTHNAIVENTIDAVCK